MRFSVAASFLALVALSGAVSITSPTKGEDVDFSKDVTVKWSSVSSDPSTFDLYVVNMNVYPNIQTKVASDVKTSADSYTISGLSGVTAGGGYQINFLSTDPQNTGILAQSQQFNAVETSSTTSSSSSTSTSSSSSSSSTSSSSETTSTGVSTTLTTAASTSSGSSTTGTSSKTSSSSSSTGTSTSSATAKTSGSATASSTASTSSSAAAAGLVPATAGGILMSLFALLL